jgi:glucan biosynthesis protein C
LFRRLFSRAHKAWDSLSANAYGIYLVHYIFVTWFQFLLLPVALPAVMKFLLTFVLSVVFSWLVTALARKIPVVKKYL